MSHRLDVFLFTRALPLLAGLIPRPVRRAVICKAAAEASYRHPTTVMDDLSPFDLMDAA